MDRLVSKEKALEFLKKYRYVLLVLVIGLALMLLPENGNSTQTKAISTPADAGEISMEQRLEEILGQIEGAGKVRVLLTERTGERYRYQSDEDITDTTDSTASRRDTVIITDSDRSQQGLLCQIDPPEYRGAVVICQGAERASVRLAIVQAVSNATGLGADRISVLKMK